ncbi:MAG: PqqD family protein [Methylacidiphilales bacterium]|nr:PqqD family protein [Candidatus Methylacidiphilales bacterium]
MKTTLEKLVLNDHGIALDPATGETYRLTGPALQLLRLLQRGEDEDGLLRFLLDEYNVDEATARRDLDVFLATLEQMKWLEGSA